MQEPREERSAIPITHSNNLSERCTHNWAFEPRIALTIARESGSVEQSAISLLARSRTSGNRNHYRQLLILYRADNYVCPASVV